MNGNSIPSEYVPIYNLLVNGVLPLLMTILIPSLIILVCKWIIYKKSGKRGWEAIVPIYNKFVLLEIIESPKWYILLILSPMTSAYLDLVTNIKLACMFGKSIEFAVFTACFPYIGLPILAFGKNNIYKGKNNQTVVDTIENITPQEFFHQEQNAVENKSINSENETMFNQNVNTEIKPISTPEETNISSEPEQLNNIGTNSNINDSNNMVNTIIEPQIQNINTQPIVPNEIEENNIIENNGVQTINNNVNPNNQTGIITNFDTPNNIVNEQPAIPNETQTTQINQNIEPNTLINGNQPMTGLNNQPQINIPTINYPQPESNQNNNQNI